MVGFVVVVRVRKVALATLPALKLFGRKRAKAMKARISLSTVHIHAICLGPHIRTFCVQAIIYGDVHERGLLASTLSFFRAVGITLMFRRERPSFRNWTQKHFGDMYPVLATWARQ